MTTSGWKRAPFVPWMQWGGHAPPNSLKCFVSRGCQSRVKRIGWPSESVCCKIRVRIGSTTARPTSSRTSRWRPSRVVSPSSSRPPGVTHAFPQPAASVWRIKRTRPRSSWMRPPADQNGSSSHPNAAWSGDTTMRRFSIGIRPNRWNASARRSLQTPGHIELSQRWEAYLTSPRVDRPRTGGFARAPRRCFGPIQQGLRRHEVRRHYLGGQDARRGGDHENVEAPEELRPHGPSGTASERVCETPGAREGRGLLAHQVTCNGHRRGRSSAAAIIIGRIAVASLSIVTCFAVSLTLPQEIPSRVRAPLKLPSHSGAVVMYTA